MHRRKTTALNQIGHIAAQVGVNDLRAGNTHDRTHLVFWIKTRNEGTPAWQDVNPPITLHGPGGKSAQLTPTGDFLSNLPYNEAREGWAYFAVPLAGNDRWKRSGDALSEIEKLDIGFDSWGAPPLGIWLDGLGLR